MSDQVSQNAHDNATEWPSNPAINIAERERAMADIKSETAAQDVDRDTILAHMETWANTIILADVDHGPEDAQAFKEAVNDRLNGNRIPRSDEVKAAQAVVAKVLGRGRGRGKKVQEVQEVAQPSVEDAEPPSGAYVAIGKSSEYRERQKGKAKGKGQRKPKDGDAVDARQRPAEFMDFLTRVASENGLNPAEAWLFTNLIWWTGKHGGNVKESKVQMADKTNMSQPTIRRALGQLIEKKLIYPDGQGKLGVTQYRVDFGQ